ncbi:anti-sigma-I factor RsgI family protein [Clostridium sp.]|uniref:anti-sigma-I factor RsgI family protein n=1 Tax=Clostridium sp. TaxID=1506 RepID=UPI003D6CAD7C
MRKAGKVINIEKDKVYIITANQEFVTLEKHSVEPVMGELYAGEELKHLALWKYFLLIVCVILIAFSARKLYLDNKYEFSVIVDMNCKLKMEVTGLNEIKSVEGKSKGGFELKETLDLKHKSLDEALHLILDESIKHGYLTKAHADDGFKISIFIVDNKNNTPIDVTKFKDYANTYNFKVIINNNGTALIE